MGIEIKIIVEIIPERWYIYITMNHSIISIQVKNLRKKVGLTQIDFAKRAGVGLRFLRELEGGKATVRLDKLNQVLDFLGFHLEIARNGSAKFDSEKENSNLM